jgi:hypothetical protein
VIHEVGANRVMLVQRECNLQLRADSVDARDQDGIVHAAKVSSKKPAEASDFAEHLRSMCSPNEMLNAALEAIPQIDVHAGAGVGFLLFCHVEQRRDISYYVLGISRDFSTSLEMTNGKPAPVAVQVERALRARCYLLCPERFRGHF